MSKLLRSQLTRISSTICSWPEVSPLRQSLPRLRLQKWTRPVCPGRVQRFVVHEADHEHGIGLALLDDRRDQAGGVEEERSVRDGLGKGHGRTGRPFWARWRFASATRYVPKWKMLAARTASARPGWSASTRWSSVPAPPEAMTGIDTAAQTASRSVEVVAVFGAVAVHAGEQDLAGAPIRRPP